MQDLQIKDPAAEIARILAGKELVLAHQSFLDSRLQEIAGFLQRLLQELEIGFLAEMLLVIIKEVVSNASRACAKRLYFKDKALDINKTEDYACGIEAFRLEALADWEAWSGGHAELKDAVALTLSVQDKCLHIKVRNHCAILPTEWERIESRLKNFRKHNSFESAMEEISDEMEGAGLGIVLCLTLLNNAGINPDNFTITSNQEQTVTEISIPLSIMPPKVKKQFVSRVLREIENVPAFPEHIARLIKLCDSETASVQRIAEEIQRDPALSAAILKLVHSAGYMNRMKNPSVTDAVKVIGLKTVKSLLMVTGVKNVINASYRVKELEQIWDRSNRVSFFARHLSRKKPALTEVVTIAGLLHYLGKIILLSFGEKQMEVIQKIYKRRSIRNASSIEENMLGIGHPEIAALLMQKWNFPENLIETIRYQNRPLYCPGEHKDLIEIVYLAIRMENAIGAQKNFYAIEYEILDHFNIAGPVEFAELLDRMQKLYKDN